MAVARAASRLVMAYFKLLHGEVAEAVAAACDPARGLFVRMEGRGSEQHGDDAHSGGHSAAILHTCRQLGTFDQRSQAPGSGVPIVGLA